jgi:surface antigen
MNTGKRTKRLAVGVLGAVICSFLAVSPAAAATHKRTPQGHTTSLHVRPHEHVVDRRPVYHHETYHHETYRHETYRHDTYHHEQASRRRAYHYAASSRAAEFRYSRLQCVPYARSMSHIELTGDAFLWWPEAAGRYARGDAPVQGAVLAFRSERRMPLGHVAVVTSVIDSRTILVTQANWVPGTITNDVRIQDVSPDNNWSQVQVQIGDRDTWGATYSTYGFIYDRPAVGTGVVVAANGAAGNQGAATEVAEAPRVAPIATEAPDRNLR